MESGTSSSPWVIFDTETQLQLTYLSDLSSPTSRSHPTLQDTTSRALLPIQTELAKPKRMCVQTWKAYTYTNIETIHEIIAVTSPLPCFGSQFPAAAPGTASLCFTGWESKEGRAAMTDTIVCVHVCRLGYVRVLHKLFIIPCSLPPDLSESREHACY